MRHSNSGTKGWWQTLPGILTAVAAIITALTGLVVALGGLGIFHRSPASPNRPAVSAESLSTAAGSTAQAQGLPLPETTQVTSGSAVYRLLSLQSAPYSADKISLRFTVRMTNSASYPVNFQSSAFRLRVNDSLQAPVNFIDEIVDSNAFKDGLVEFIIPAGASTVGFQMGEVGVDKPDIPMHLPGDAKPATPRQ